jgi:hypothetical protein
LTFDLDFGEIVPASAGQTVSVVLFRLMNTWRGIAATKGRTFLAPSPPGFAGGEGGVRGFGTRLDLIPLTLPSPPQSRGRGEELGRR